MRVKAVVVAAWGVAVLLGAWPAAAHAEGPARSGDHQGAGGWSDHGSEAEHSAREGRHGAAESSTGDEPPPSHGRPPEAAAAGPEQGPTERRCGPQEGGGRGGRPESHHHGSVPEAAEPQEHPAEPEEHPVEPEEHHAEPEEHHAEPEEHHAEPEEHHAESPGPTQAAPPPAPRGRSVSRAAPRRLNPVASTPPPRLVSLWTPGPATPPQPSGAGSQEPAPPASAAGIPRGPRPLVVRPPVTRLIDLPVGPVPPVLAFILVGIGLLLMARRRRLAGRGERELEEAKETFIRVASHELRTPLTVVRGYLAMAAEGSLSPLPAEMREVLRTVSGNVDDLHRVAELLLEAAQVDTRQLHLQKTVVDLRDVVRDCVGAMEGGAFSRPGFVLEAGPRRVPVRADPDRLCTVIVNLVENAFRHSPEDGEVRCSVSTSGRQARIDVTDQGPGIPPEDRSALFTPFGSSSFAGGRFAGSGLGLYVARELARLHGGDVEVRTDAGRGSTFTVVLPLAESRWTGLRRHR